MAEETTDLETTQEEENSNEVLPNDDNNEAVEGDETLTEQTEEFVKDKKKSLLRKVLIAIIIFLVLVVISGAGLYFSGYFDVEENVKQEEVKKVEPKEEIIKEIKTYNFDLNDINSKKLNKELSYLTNKNLNQEKIDEKEKLDSEKRILEEEKKKKEEALKKEEELVNKEKMLLEAKKEELEKQKEELEILRQEALSLKQEMIDAKNQLETKEMQTQVDTKQNMMEEAPKEVNITTTNEFVNLINVAKIKGVLYKSYLDKITAINPNVLLCRDDKNRIEIYYGPFVDKKNRNDILNKLIKNNIKEAYEVELTQEEFDKRCNY